MRLAGSEACRERLSVAVVRVLVLRARSLPDEMPCSGYASVSL